MKVFVLVIIGSWLGYSIQVQEFTSIKNCLNAKSVIESSRNWKKDISVYCLEK